MAGLVHMQAMLIDHFTPGLPNDTKFVTLPFMPGYLP